MITSKVTLADIQERNRHCNISNIPKNTPLLTACEKDFSLFMTHMLGFKPYAWQFLVNKRLKAEGQNKIVFCNSRQIGKSRYIAALALWRVYFNLGYKCRRTSANMSQHTAIGIISRSDGQAKDLLKTIRKLIQIGDAKMASYKANGKQLFGESWFSDRVAQASEGQNNMNMITFKKGLGGSLVGSTIVCLPPTDAILGNTLTDLYLDEAARIDDTIIEENALPTLNAMGNMLVVASTPVLPDGYFFKRVDPYESGKNNDFERFMFSIDALEVDAPEQYALVLKDIKQLLEDGKDNEVQRNFYCSFVSTDTTFFPIDKLKNAFTPNLSPHSEYKDEVVVLGIDFGGSQKSHTVMTAVTMPDVSNQSKRIQCWRYKLRQDADIITDIEELILPNYNVGMIVIDYCPASYMISQMMEKKGWNIQKFIFSRTTKPDFMDRFRRRLSRGLNISYEDQTLYDEFLHYGDDMKPMGDYTDDMIDSWMLACVPFLEQKSRFGAIIVNQDDNPYSTPEDYLIEQERLSRERKSSLLGGSVVI